MRVVETSGAFGTGRIVGVAVWSVGGLHVDDGAGLVAVQLVVLPLHKDLHAHKGDYHVAVKYCVDRILPETFKIIHLKQ